MNQVSEAGELQRSSQRHRDVEAPEVAGAVLLAVDTALGTSVALGVNGRIFEASSDDPLRHAEALGGMLRQVFDAAEIAPDAVTGVVVGIGPGPFTGLRVGIAAAQAFALGRGVPLLPLQGHEAVALAVLEQGAAARVRIVQDAKRRELFVTEYQGLNWAGIPERTVDPHLVTRVELQEGASDVWPERIPAARLVQLAARRLASGQSFEAEQAVYLRAPDVAQPGAPKRVST